MRACSDCADDMLYPEYGCRLKSEFDCGDALGRKNLGEEDLERLVIEQIEFCNIILLNKISEVTPEEAGRIRAIIRAIQPRAEIIECD